jgi:hypothetical protein
MRSIKTPKVATPKKTNPTDMRSIKIPKEEEEDDYSTDTDEKAYPKKDVDKVKKIYKSLSNLKAGDPKEKKLYEKLGEIKDGFDILAYLEHPIR